MAKKSLIFALFLTLVAVFLRFYRLPEFVTFLGDQGRDAIVLRRIVTLEHFPAIGAPTSVGQVYLGPFYYYLVAPWLLLANFNPIGPAIGVAVLSSLFVLINYFIVKKLFDTATALISSTLITFSTVLIELSRFSWNPNLLPLFSLLTMYATILAVKKHKLLYYGLTGVFLSCVIQLHYLGLFLAPAVAIIFLWDLFEHKKDWLRAVRNIFVSFGAFLLFSFPLLVFDLRHDFLNSKNFIKLFQTSSATQGANRLAELIQTFFFLNKHLFQTDLNVILLAVLLVMTLILFFLNIRTNRSLAYIILFFLTSLAGLSLYAGPKYPHYYGAIYASYIILLSYLLSSLLRSKYLIPVLALFIGGFIFLNSRGYYFFWEKGSNQILHAQKIAKTIQSSVTRDKYAVTALPNQYSDSTYRYFLEVWGKRSLEKDSLEPAGELFVICEGACKPIGNPQWDIAYFKPKKVVETKKIFPSVTMYRLTN